MVAQSCVRHRHAKSRQSKPLSGKALLLACAAVTLAMLSFGKAHCNAFTAPKYSPEPAACLLSVDGGVARELHFICIIAAAGPMGHCLCPKCCQVQAYTFRAMAGIWKVGLRSAGITLQWRSGSDTVSGRLLPFFGFHSCGVGKKLTSHNPNQATCTLTITVAPARVSTGQPAAAQDPTAITQNVPVASPPVDVAAPPPAGMTHWDWQPVVVI